MQSCEAEYVKLEPLGSIGVILGLYWGYLGIMENVIESSIVD